MRTRSKTARLVAIATAVYGGACAMVALHAQGQGTRPRVPVTSMLDLKVPESPALGSFVRDKQAAIVLGKAFFWDMQASSDNMLACASCHFHAGADFRTKNALNPNLTNQTGAATSTKFDVMASGNHGGPNYTLAATDFPFHQLADPNDRESAVMFDSNDVVSSAGVYNSEFKALLGQLPLERQTFAPDGVFQVGGIETRRVEPRNTPSVINAALNYRNFWDGRANSVFNGVNPFGPRDQKSQIWMDDYYTPKGGALTERAVPSYVRIPMASAASQAVGPALSAFEMSAAGRQFKDLGRKLLGTRPLLYQRVSAADSVLGPYRHPIGLGLSTNYEPLIKQAFYPEYWQVPDAVFQASSGMPYRQIEANFSLFWGLAIQAYEATLISDDSRFDRYAKGNLAALTPLEKEGLAIFSDERGRCVTCHKGSEFTGASTRMVLGSGIESFGGDGPIENMLMGSAKGRFATNRPEALYDNGFYNIGVVPTANDLGVGGSDPFGNPLSFTRSFKNMLTGGLAPDSLSHSLNPCTYQIVEGCAVVTDPNIRDAVDGSFKAPSLRNVELTGPYFHTGGVATLEQVVDFYNRGGNVRTVDLSGRDTSGFGKNSTNLDTDIMALGLTAHDKAALVAFLKALTDERVRWEKAPFDHPSLLVPSGAYGDNNSLTTLLGHAVDQFLSIPAVGAAGASAPLQPFTPR